ncbi:MAG: tetratricopeptide repeat protein [Deltaproteobacteria bacterium]|nr:tetratricopeptide repeat protein [Deltaproteobacteria bacterium]
MSPTVVGARRPPAISRLVKVIRRRFGLDFGGQRFPLLLEGLSTHGRDPEHTAEGLLSEEPARLARFIEQLANHETYFLRHPMQLEAVRTLVLEQAAEARGRGRIGGGALQAWSAGCSTGEEPLSLSITLLEAREEGGPQEIKILATDLSSAALTRARRAHYGEWSFRGVPDSIRERYFRQIDKHYEPHAAVRAPIAYEQHNLLKGSPGGATFDLVVCRNVLIYFDRPALEAAFATFQSAVRPGGILVLGPAEGAARIPPGFTSIDVDGVIVYQREDGAARRAPALPSTASEVAPRPGRLHTPARRRGSLGDGGAMARSAARRAARARQTSADGGGPAVELSPISPVTMARLAADQGRHDDARHLLQSATGLPGEESEALVILTLVELDSGHLDEAAESLDRLLAREPDSLMGRYLMGNLLSTLGRREAACDWYQQALKLVEAGAGADDTPVEGGGGLSRAELHQTLLSLLGSCGGEGMRSGGHP